MKKLLKILLASIFLTSEIVWQFFLFFAFWANADGGNKYRVRELYFPSFFANGIGDGGVLTYFITIVSVFNSFSIAVSIIFITFMIYLKISKGVSFRAKKDLTPEELRIVQRNRKEINEVLSSSILLSLITLIILYAMIASGA